jgi:ABC-type transport system involved in multi-copper enzyme maturation permease subunit
MNMLTRRLIAKEFYLNRWLIVISTIAGLAGLLTAMEGTMRFNIGMLTWLTTIVAFGVVLAMMSIANERKERALQFVLSLPLSHGDYVRIKLLGLLLCYLVPWAVLSLSAVALILVMPNLPDGLLPNTVLLCGFMLANFSIVVCGALHTASEGVMTLVIIVTNMNVTLFIFLVAGLSPLSDQMHAPTATWNATFWTVLAVEIATLIITLSLPHFVAARRRDFN